MTGIPGARSSPRTARVWDPVVRLVHWSLATSIAAAWLTSTWRDSIHNGWGYAAAAFVAARLLWGLVGPRYARFSQFCRHPASVVAYLRSVLSGREKRFIGHNPAGGAMIVALLAVIAVVAVHLCGVVLASLRHRENLVKAMITGQMRPAGAGDVA